jgi:hypothetical protein
MDTPARVPRPLCTHSPDHPGPRARTFFVPGHSPTTTHHVFVVTQPLSRPPNDAMSAATPSLPRRLPRPSRYWGNTPDVTNCLPCSAKCFAP